MHPFLRGFCDELVKLGVADAAAAGTGIKPPKPIQAIKPINPLKPINAIQTPKFKPPPGLASPKLPRFGTGLGARVPRRQGLPRAWMRPGATS